MPNKDTNPDHKGQPGQQGQNDKDDESAGRTSLVLMERWATPNGSLVRTVNSIQRITGEGIGQQEITIMQPNAEPTYRIEVRETGPWFWRMRDHWVVSKAQSFGPFPGELEAQRCIEIQRASSSRGREG